MNKNILMAIVVFAVAFGLAFAHHKITVHKVTRQVIEELQRDYSPGPYQPGFDPDKVNPDSFRNQQPMPQPQYQPPAQTPPPQYFGRPEDWNSIWESQRR